MNDGTYTTSYVYDSLNQLIRENDERAGKTYTYAYTNGNITDKKTYYYTAGELGSEIGYKTWEYENSTWGDLLTNYDGTEITYDEIGNPVTYGSASLEWQGRQLQSITEGDAEISFAYNGEGQRVSKTFDGVTTEFYYNGSILAGQKTGEDSIIFEYDNNGDPFAFLYNGTEYYYVKNAQNDVTAIANAAGTVLANYYYDAWGNILTISGDTALADANPIRYRSYYCDTETGWYYLNSRYYVPEMCRMLNSDDDSVASASPMAFTDKNLFAYCDNNPVSRADSDGEFWHIVVGAAVGAAISAVSGVIAGDPIESILVSAAAGAASGALACTGIGLAASIAANAAISATESIVTQGIENGFSNVDYGEVVFDTAIGAISGKGTGTKRLTYLGKKTVSRTKNALFHKGLKAYGNEAKKAAKYYFKSTKKYYKGFFKGTIKDFGKNLITSFASKRLFKR